VGTTSSGGFELLLLGGRAGVGKTSVAAEVSLLLREAGVTHCHIEGDVLDAAHPKPPEDPEGSGMTERNLRSLAGGYRRLGYRRLVYVNTVSVVEPDLVRRAVGEVRSTVSVLLEADDTTVQARLSSRERGSELPAYRARGPAMAQALDNEAGADVHRLDVSNSSVREAAERVLDLTGWLLGPDDDVEPVHEPARFSGDVVLDEAVLSLVGRDDEAAVAEFLTGSDWPFHTGGRPTRDEVVARVRSGHYDADGTATFLVRESGRAVALVRLSDLDDDSAMFDLRVADAEGAARGRGMSPTRRPSGAVSGTPGEPGPSQPGVSSPAPATRTSKYAHVEREVRFRLPRLPELPAGCRVLVLNDRYVPGTGLRLRRVEEAGRAPLLKLGQKVRLDPSSAVAVAHTALYLTPEEYAVLAVLPARELRKTRHLVEVGDGLHMAIDVFEGALAGLVTAEVDLGEQPDLLSALRARDEVQALLAGSVDVTADERHTGGALAAAATAPPWPTCPTSPVAPRRPGNGPLDLSTHLILRRD